MWNQNEFGKRLKEMRGRAGVTQKETANQIGVSEQALSKWENGICLPDVYNLKLLARVLRVSVDYLLDTDGELREQITESIKVGNAVFEVVEKPSTIFAGKVMYAKDYVDYEAFDASIGTIDTQNEQDCYEKLEEEVFPRYDVHLSVNF